MPEPKRVEIVAGAEEVRLGSFLFTIVEPHRGHEVEYNRWYERDHFYSGCLIGPYNFAGRRFVATADLKKLRAPDPSEITGEPRLGSYLALYWILAGHGEVWGRWAGQQVMALHQAGRMFEHRDHVHTQIYDFAWQASSGDGVPAELVLDHPYRGLVTAFVEADPGAEDDVDRLLEQDVEARLAAGLPGTVLVARPQPMAASAPGVQQRDAPAGRRLCLWFLAGEPVDHWPVLRAHADALESSGGARVAALLPWLPTVPGTDTYTDRLWAD